MDERHRESRTRKDSFSRRASVSIIGIQLALFSCVWTAYYNLYAFRTHRGLGGTVTLLLYLFIYNRLVKIYRADKPAQYSVGETVFSQLLAFGITDLIFYVECCFIARRYVSILPGLMTTVVQFLAACAWAVVAKRYYMNHITPQETTIVYGDGSVSIFLAKIHNKPWSLLTFTDRFLPGKVWKN